MEDGSWERVSQEPDQEVQLYAENMTGRAHRITLGVFSVILCVDNAES